jgi:probable HAF family extracellular repeat protein
VLGTLGGAISSASGRRAVNSRGDVVGESTTADGTLHGFLWRNGMMVDLNALLPPGTAAEVTRALAISDSGWIAAIARITGTERAVPQM